jgi:dihydroorotate dehydrogenase (fumarate)
MVHASLAKLRIDPPLLNSASPWATTYKDLKALYSCPFTGAVTVRTSLLEGFQHDQTMHQYAFFDSGSAVNVKGDESIAAGRTSLNTLGYSPIPLDEYLEIVRRVVTEQSGGDGSSELENGTHRERKPIILSVTGTPEEVEKAYLLIQGTSRDHGLELGMEINLSCPNIKGKPPPAYDGAALAEYLVPIQTQKKMLGGTLTESPGVGRSVVLPPPPVGIKLPPYTYIDQFEEVVGAIACATVDGKSVVDFMTATNTLGSSLVLNEKGQPALASEAGTGIGGLAGAALHPLALGNVATLRKVLDRRKETKEVFIIGVGGVSDHGGFERMRKVGAGAVAVATALGREGVGVFEKILTEKGGDGEVISGTVAWGSPTWHDRTKNRDEQVQSEKGL